MTIVGFLMILADIELKTGWLAIAGLILIVSRVDDDDHPNDNMRKR